MSRWDCVDAHRRGRAGHSDGNGRERLDLKAAEETFERSGALVVADEAVGKPQRQDVRGSGDPDSGREPPRAAEVLDGRGRASLDDP
jgi:hypothetical protein